jgi:hypothetical protein
MPTWFFRKSLVMRNPGGDTAWTQCAANVEIKTRLLSQITEAADFHAASAK